MTPYYDSSGLTIYHGDARDVLPQLGGAVDTMITDPTWPNATVDLFGKDDPERMFREIMAAAPESIQRVAVHLGCDSDARFLQAVPDRFAFFRTCWLELRLPHHKGRLLYTSDIAYLFGEPPPSRKGAHVVPGKYIDTSSRGREAAHPCPRKLAHAMWLVRWWSAPEDAVVDPCMGSGTTLAAAARMGRRCIGIEVEEEFCEMAVRERIQQREMFTPEAA